MLRWIIRNKGDNARHAACSVVASVGVEHFLMQICAQVAAVDGGDADRGEAQACEGVQVRLETTIAPWPECGRRGLGCSTRSTEKRIPHLCANLEGRGSN